MSKDCKIARRTVLLGEPATGLVAEHLRTCSACRVFAETEQATARLVRERTSRPSAPVALRERIAASFAAATRQARHPRRHRRPLTIAAGVAAIAALAGSGVWYGLRDGRRLAERTVAQVAEDYFEFASRSDRVEIATGVRAEVESWLQDRVGLAVSVPALAGAEILGARRCSLAGRPTALVFYRLHAAAAEPALASLFVFQGAGEDWRGMQSFEGSARMPIHRDHHRGVSVLVWQRLGLTYALVSPFDDEQLASVVRSL